MDKWEHLLDCFFAAGLVGAALTGNFIGAVIVGLGFALFDMVYWQRKKGDA